MCLFFSSVGLIHFHIVCWYIKKKKELVKIDSTIVYTKQPPHVDKVALFCVMTNVYGLHRENQCQFQIPTILGIVMKPTTLHG